ncbi:MAG: hypothetical protein N3G20_06890, partial [Verrucomicrobiae bacterium]|nr:hypothetical protein [Verrucomicrobiae bacterium]
TMEAELVDGVTIGTNTYSPKFSGNLTGESGIEGEVTGKLGYCFGTGFSVEYCGNLWARRNFSGVVKAVVPVYDEHGFEGTVEAEEKVSFDLDVLLANARKCDKGGKSSIMAEDDAPTVFYLGREAFLRPEHEIQALLGLTPFPRSGVCAHVRLRLEQDAVVGRDAFNASLTLENGEPAPLEQVYLSLTVQDAEVRDVTERFFIDAPVLSGVSAVDGTVFVPGSE